MAEDQGRMGVPDGSRPVALVTGVSSGIGKACAHHLSRHGYRVYGAARSATAREDDGVTLLPLDVRNEGMVKDTVSRVVQEAGRIDVLLNCAGVIVAGPVEDLLPDEIMDQIQTNLLGTMRMCQAVLPGMRKRRSGLIVNISSIGGLMGLPFQSTYSASKFGIEGFSESLQIEVRDFGIRVVVVEPGDIATEVTVHRRITRGIAADSPYRKNLDDAMRSQSTNEINGWDVERVARFIGRIVQSRSPRFRYRPGPFMEVISPTFRRVMPDRLFLKVLASFSGIKPAGRQAPA